MWHFTFVYIFANYSVDYTIQYNTIQYKYKFALKN